MREETRRESRERREGKESRERSEQKSRAECSASTANMRRMGIAFVLLMSLLAYQMCLADADTTFMSGICHKLPCRNGTAYQHNVRSVLSKLMAKVQSRPLFDVWDEASDAYDNSETAYGVAGCNTVTPEECRYCLQYIVTNLQQWCPKDPLSAKIVLKDCYLHYDRYYITVPESQRREQ